MKHDQEKSKTFLYSSNIFTLVGSDPEGILDSVTITSQILENQNSIYYLEGYGSITKNNDSIMIMEEYLSDHHLNGSLSFPHTSCDFLEIDLTYQDSIITDSTQYSLFKNSSVLEEYGDDDA